jgi:hypothetical protein
VANIFNPSDVRDKEWGVLEPFFPAHSEYCPARRLLLMRERLRERAKGNLLHSVYKNTCVQQPS